MLCACGVQFSVDHAMACERVGFIIQRHNVLRDLEAEMLRMVCSDVEVEPVLQEVTGETINMALTKPLMPVWIFMLEVFGRDRDLPSSTSGCHPNADSYRDLTPKQIYKKHEKEAVCGKSNGDQTGNVHSPGFHDHRWDGE